MPEGLKTAELCLAAVRKDAASFIHVPDELKTAELCLAAVKA
ncbi:MAG: DUF4116 domain-containing protein [Treponema sp.]|nr:DUF4116 domain-containing protein [Treponema sp.]